MGAELRQAFADLSSHPSLAIVCGNQEVDEIAAMNGGLPSGFESELFDTFIPSLTAELLPGVEFVTTNPTGGDPLYRPDTGVSQYFGIGGYLRPPQRAAPRRRPLRHRVPLLTPRRPSPRRVDAAAAAPNLAVHDPGGRRACTTTRAARGTWTTSAPSTCASVFGVDPLWERYSDAERALDLGRATNAVLDADRLHRVALQRAAPAGGLVLGFNDLAPGAGWGLIDVDGQPKAPWYAMRRVCEPVCVLLIDEGLNGLCAHVFNDTAEAFSGDLVVDLFTNGETLSEQAVHPVIVKARGATVVNLDDLFDDSTTSTTPTASARPSTTSSPHPQGRTTARCAHDAVSLPLGQARPVEGDSA